MNYIEIGVQIKKLVVEHKYLLECNDRQSETIREFRKENTRLTDLVKGLEERNLLLSDEKLKLLTENSKLRQLLGDCDANKLNLRLIAMTASHAEMVEENVRLEKENKELIAKTVVLRKTNELLARENETLINNYNEQQKSVEYWREVSANLPYPSEVKDVKKLNSELSSKVKELEDKVLKLRKINDALETQAKSSYQTELYNKAKILEENQKILINFLKSEGYEVNIIPDKEKIKFLLGFKYNVKEVDDKSEKVKPIRDKFGRFTSGK